MTFSTFNFSISFNAISINVVPATGNIPLGVLKVSG
jgi:hypothetical protein